MLFKTIPNILPNNKGPLALDVLWENADPLASMSGVTVIPLEKDATNYDALVCQWRTESTTKNMCWNETSFLWNPDNLFNAQHHAATTFCYNDDGTLAKSTKRQIEYLSNRNYIKVNDNNNPNTMVLSHIFGLRLNNTLEQGVTDQDRTWIVSPYRAVDGSVQELCPSFSPTLQQNGAQPLSCTYTTDGLYDFWEIQTEQKNTSYCILLSDTPVDVTNYSQIIARCYSYCYENTARFGVISSKITQASGGQTGALQRSVLLVGGTGRKAIDTTVVLDVSDLTGNYYIGLQVGGTSNYSGIARLYWAFIQ